MTTIRAAGRDWTPEQAHRLRMMFADTTLLTKEIARAANINVRNLWIPAFRRKLGLKGRRPRNGARNNIGRLAIPEGVHTAVAELYRLINRERITAKEVAARAGLCAPAIYLWRKQVPRIDTLDAALGVLGYRLAVVPLAEES